MPSTYSNIKIQLMATGENNTTWGNVTNINLGTALEEAIVGSADVTFASANVTLTLTDTNASQTARHMRLRCTGVTGGSTRNLVVPSIEKPYIVQNDCSDSILVKTAAGTGITVPAGKTMWVYSDGTNVVNTTTHLSSLTLGTDLAVADGGTGASTFTANGVLLGNGTSAIQVTAVGATGQVLVGNTGAAPSWTALSGIGVTSLSFGSTGLTPATATTGAITVAGTLGVANGGTGTATAFTAGSVVFAGASGVYSQDNANFFWDDTNNRLGIGTATPTAKLSVAGNQINTVADEIYAVALKSTSGSLKLSPYRAAHGGSILISFNADESVYAPFTASAAYIRLQTDGTERMRITTAGNVGIGTSAPDVTLHVQSSTGQARVQNTTSGTALIGFRNSTTTDVPWVGTGGDDIRITTQSAERMRITSGGNIGIGSNNPATWRMYVSQAGSDLLNLYNSTGTGVQLTMADQGWQGGVNMTNGNLIFQSGGTTERMRIDATGNVGIGTTSPAAKLQVDNGDIIINKPTLGNTSFSYDGSTAAITVNSSSAPLTLGTFSAERMRITSAGDVGIGTVSPGAKLDVRGIGQFLSGATGSFNFIDVGRATPEARVAVAASSGDFVAGTAAGDAIFYNPNSANAWFGVAGAGAAVFTTNSTERMRINTSGFVGIGTTNPLSRLVVSNGSNENMEFTSGSVSLNGGVIEYINRGAFPTTRPDLNYYIGVPGAHKFYTDTFERMRIDSTGFVGIGTSTPSTKLDVNGTSNFSDNMTLSRTNTAGSLTGITVTNAGTTSAYAGININSGPVSAQLFNDAAGNAVVAGTILRTTTAHPLVFGTNGSERMRITSAGAVGIATTAPAAGQLQIDGTGEVRLTNPANTSGLDIGFWGGTGDASAYIYQRANSSMFFGTNNAARMTITGAGNVGIGTTGPSYPLEVRQDGASSATYIGSLNTTATGSTGIAGYLARAGSNFAYFYVRGDGTAYLENATANPLGFAVNGFEAMRITSTGGVGIGTSAPNGKLTVAGSITAFTTGVTDQLIMEPLTAGSGSIILSVNDANNAYRDLTLNASTQIFKISNTERMRIDASGNVGIGTNNPSSGRLVVDSGASSTTAVFNSTTDTYIQLQNSGTNGFYIQSASAAAYLWNQLNTPLLFATNNTERMRIDSSGNVGIGTTSPVYKLVVSNAGAAGIEFDPATGIIQTYNRTTAAYTNLSTYGLQQRFFSGSSPSERMRIDSDGNLLVGKTAVADTTVGFQAVGNTGSSQLGSIVSTLAGSTSGNQTMLVYSTGAAAYRFYVDMAGTVYATSTTISAISDIRFKENVRELDAGLDTILALKPRRFDWKQGKGKDVRDDMGFIAQEVEEVLPELIGGWKAGEGEPDDLKSVKAGDLIPVLVKAIQELTARVAQLEERK